MGTKTKPFTGRIEDNVLSQLRAVFIETLQKCRVFYVIYAKLLSVGAKNDFPQIFCFWNGEYLFDDIPSDLISVKDTPIARQADFVLGVIGDSMEPTYHDGDKVFVEKTDMIEIGEIGIFFVGSQCYIKEAGADGLISHNPKYKPIPGTENIRCVGRVLGKAEI